MKKLCVKEIQNISLDILVEFDRFCRTNNLKYYLAWGTLLGAVRHQGFIPWDDDVDVFMPRPDFEKFQKIYTDHDNYKLYSTKRVKKYFLTHMKLCNIKTYQIKNNGEKDERGVDIDIFALDGQNPDLNKAKKIYSKTHKKFLKYIAKSDGRTYLLPVTMKNRILLYFTHLLEQNGILNYISKKIDRQFRYFDYYSTDIISPAHAIFSGGYLWWKKDVFSDGIELTFEGKEFCAPRKYDELLTKTYGEYMKLPPLEKQVSTHQEKYYWTES